MAKLVYTTNWTPKETEWCVLSTITNYPKYLKWALTNRGLLPAYSHKPQWFKSRKEAEALIVKAKGGELGQKYDAFRIDTPVEVFSEDSSEDSSEEYW